MKSLLIEFHRFGDLGTGLLRKGDRYLIAAANRPVREFSINIDHRPFLRLMQALRYPSGEISSGDQALNQIGDLVSEILPFEDLCPTGNAALLQLDLVVNAPELASLPFEAFKDHEGRPVLAQRHRPVELARRVRQEFAEIAVRWPAEPRVLFAWAAPFGLGATVPYEQHEQALRAALDPWIPLQDDTGSEVNDVLVVLPKASLNAIEAVCRAAIEGKRPFTHVHILAHGYPVGRGFDQRFGLALHSTDSEEMTEAAPPEALCAALAPLRGEPVIVSLAACDAANETNPIIPERSVAHELHVSGIPVVVASQLPLTKVGSTVLVEQFYRSLLAGTDIRLALHEARAALFECAESGHDWASLVAYVRLPEGYAEHLAEVRLESVRLSLKAIQSLCDRLNASDIYKSAQFTRLVDLLTDRLTKLKGFVSEAERAGRRKILDENLGLLGSTEKRLAELHFMAGLHSGAAGPQELVHAGLRRAYEWYRIAFRENLSHHWTGTQFLSLESVLFGNIADPTYWHACVLAADLDRRRPEEYWALGSLAELYLIAPAAGLPDRTEEAANAITEMKAGVLKASNDQFPLQSMQRQLGRYVDWWTVSHGFFPGRDDFSAPARRLAAILDP